VFQPESAFNDLDDWHFADIAGSIGGHGVRVSTRAELSAALDAAVKRRGVFSLIEVMLPRGVTSKTLERFVAGFKAARERMK
jgi:indolepyruvate decarboxylase